MSPQPPTKTHRVIFVCSGNICRSPMAAVIAAPKFDERGISHRIISAGTLGLVNRRADAHAIAAVAEWGLDLSDHRSQSANSGILKLADVIAVMSPSHTRHITRHAPTLRARVLELWRFAPPSRGALREISDPIGRDLEAFRLARDRIAESIEGWLDRLDR